MGCNHDESAKAGRRSRTHLTISSQLKRHTPVGVSKTPATKTHPMNPSLSLRLYLYNKLEYRINTQRSTGTDHALPISIDAADKPAALPAVSCRMQEACSRCCESAATTAVAAAGAREVSKSANKPPGREGLLGLGLRSCGLDRRDVRRTEARRALVNLDR